MLKNLESIGNQMHDATRNEINVASDLISVIWFAVMAPAEKLSFKSKPPFPCLTVWLIFNGATYRLMCHQSTDVKITPLYI